MLTHWAKTAFLSGLGSLTGGTLRVVCPDCAYRYGDPGELDATLTVHDEAASSSGNWTPRRVPLRLAALVSPIMRWSPSAATCRDGCWSTTRTFPIDAKRQALDARDAARRGLARDAGARVGEGGGSNGKRPDAPEKGEEIPLLVTLSEVLTFRSAW